MHNIIEITKDFVKQLLPVDPTGHDWHHAFRVWKTAKYIAQHEGANLLIVELGALLHDIADWKFSSTDNHGSLIARDFLTTHAVSEDIIAAVCHIIENVSFKGANSPNTMNSFEGRIVQDADKLDALGAIGIARTFAYGGFKGRPIYDPMILPTNHLSFEEYKNSQGTTINHFYEKLLHLKGMMHTATGKVLATRRHEFLKLFLLHFKDEWNNISLKKLAIDG